MSQSERTEFLEYCSPWTEQAVFFYGATVDVSAGGVTKSANLAAAGPGDGGCDRLPCGDVPVSYPERGGVLINNGLAEALGVSVGDLLTLRSSDMQARAASHLRSFRQLLLSLRISDAGNVCRLAGCFSGGPVRLPSKPSGHGSACRRRRPVRPVLRGLCLRQCGHTGAGRRYAGSLNYIVLLVILCAGCLAFIVLYT